MSRPHDFQIADVDDHLGGKMIITRRDINHCPRLSASVIVRIPLPSFDICNDAVDYFPNILIWIANRPFCYVIIIYASHIIPSVSSILNLIRF